MSDVIDAIKLIRQYGILKQWTNHQIMNGILTASLENALAYTRDATGKVDGICFGRWSSDFSAFHVIAIAGKGKPKFFVRFLREKFPQCKTITGFKPKRGNTLKTIKIL